MTKKELALLKKKDSDSLNAVANYVTQNGTLPNMLSDDVKERQLASWLIRWENGLTSIGWEMRKVDSMQSHLNVLTGALQSCEERMRNSQWRWWSSLTMNILHGGGEQATWHEMVFMPSPEEQAEKLGIKLLAVRRGKPGWDGGAWGVDVRCIDVALSKLYTGQSVLTKKAFGVHSSATDVEDVEVKAPRSRRQKPSSGNHVAHSAVNNNLIH
jgi:hypothetical protein